MTPAEKAARTKREKKAARLEEVERQLQEASDDYATAHLHGDDERIPGIFERLRELGRERRGLRYSS